jgi:hypothetical protein
VPDRLDRILKIVCLILGIALLARVCLVGIHFNPLRGVSIPALPALAADTNAVASATNRPARSAGTNAAKIAATATNIAFASGAESNMVARVETNVPAVAGMAVTESTASAPKSKRQPNAAPGGEPAVIAAETPAGANPANAKSITDTNTVNLAGAPAMNGTPKPRVRRASEPGGASAMMLAGMGPGGMAARKLPDLPPSIQARVNRVVESEILGPVPHPMPMALLGIAGNFAFLRSPNGQTGMVKEGEALGELKLVRIGVNRVLVEQDGKPQELMIFSGYGGESLLPKTTEHSNEPITN